MRHYLLALQFFTRIPVTGALARWAGYTPERLRASAAHFPGVGLLVGLVAAAAFMAVLAVLPATPASPFVAAAVSTALTVYLTGAFHEDGLADVADGLGGSADRDRALEIMKDSRVGAYGAIAIALALLIKLGLLSVLGALDGVRALGALVAAHAVSRFMPLVLIRVLPYVGDAAGSKSKPLADRIEPGRLLVGALWVAVALGIASLQLAPHTWLAGLAASGAVLLWMWRLFARRLGGFTGDGLGATQQCCEIAFYFGVAVAP